ncbi:DUF1801 domain-containing protein [Marinoscillum pacificum]|uniref:DUF1801 domain-containing protein n=1 Tax=Marinoscillum pacificum TaxID=392723 RepID=UPI0021588445|nr:DUF1801 domain-containing protein [Marinoscillum pacificum]
MEIIESQEVYDLLESYPEKPREKLTELRSLIIEVAESLELPKLLETTKWAEPSYVVNKGSTIRMDWKSRTPDKFHLYFICSTELVSTFRFLFNEELEFEGNRAIVLDIDKPLPKPQLKKCIELALTYHKVKNLPFLGA